MPQQVDMKSSKRSSSEINDNNNKQHISNQNEATQSQLRSKRNRQLQPQQHIYENLPASASTQQLRKYFRREVIYENLCHGCGYGVFAAQGRYCHFCQCIVSGSVVAALQQQQPQHQPQPQSQSASSGSECNIYENICELCRGIYSDSEPCACLRSATPTGATAAPIEKTPPAATPATAKAGKSRTLLGYSKSSAATLTRLFGSLKQLNRSGSMQRRLFQKEAVGGGKVGGGAGGSLEIIHNVGEVFRTQETFDMQRICELKRQLQCSRSDQHIYGRLRSDREPEPEPLPQSQSQSQSPSQSQPEPEPEPEHERQTEGASAAEVTRKKPRISRMRLLRQDQQQLNCQAAAAAAPSTSAALFLNESICQWMNALRRELHSYEDANGGVGCQQPKSVPPAYEREREREQVAELVTLRRSEAAAAAEAEAEPAAQQRLVNDFKRKLLAKPYFQLDAQLGSQLAQNGQVNDDAQLDDRRRRRCGINERHDAAFVSEFLSGLAVTESAKPAAELEISVTTTQTTCNAVAAAAAALLTGCLSLPQLWQTTALAASLHRSVIFYCSYDKLLSAFLQRRQRLRSDSIERWLRRYRRYCESDNNNIAECESASRQQQRRRQRRRLLEPPTLELAVVLATPPSDDVAAVTWHVGSISNTLESCGRESVSAIVSVSVCESEQETRSECASSDDGVVVGRALMAAPKQSAVTERSSSDDSENNSNNNNNNNNSSSNSSNNSDSNNKECDNVNQQQQQQQQQQTTITQNCVIKVRRPAPQVPVRNPTTALTKNQNEKSNNSNNNNNKQNENKSSEANVAINQVKELRAEAEMEAAAKTATEQQQQQQQEEKEKEKEQQQQQQQEEEEESIYQTIWQFKTVEPVPVDNEEEEEDFEIIAATDATASDDDADTEFYADAETDADVYVDADDVQAEELALQAAAAFAAGARHRLTKQTTPAPLSPLPSPTASMDQGAWETDDEFMFAKADEQQQRELQQQQQQQRQRQQLREQQNAETLSVGSTVTNSTATLGSISSRGSAGSSSLDSSAATAPQTLTHPLLRNICICYSLKEPQKYNVIFYDYERAQLHQHFMTRRRCPPPPPPPAKWAAQLTTTSPAIGNLNSNDDSGCSCEADADELPDHIPHPLKEDWALALLAASASSKRGVAARAGRKLRVRSSGRLLIPTSVLAWREQLQDVNYCEDEEDMIVPVSDILRAQQIKEDNEVQQTQQSTILQRFKSASIANLDDLPGEEDKKSIRNRMRMKFHINRSPKSEKKSRTRRSQVNSLCLDEQSKYPLFGARLNLLELNMSDHPYVPRFVVDVCAHIEQPDCIKQDGLYRASGNKLLVDELKRKLTHVYDPRLLQTDDIHTLTSLHKQFFRELPAPLITQEAYDRLGSCLTDDAAIELMHLSFDEMPEPNRSTLRFLIKHLTNVAAFSSDNRMPASNLAIVWGPCLLAANNINFNIGRMNMLAKVLIENYERIFRPANERLVC
ncbi:hypothetical protein AWZ03_012787 [Drosophila navojoa]|uniref:Rho-GAP domain-containing protein n=1 Tax=Drosophila navojoa TaxID=7232 RepID=A0A484AW09_DRONA|nr:uncharacterized protein LOC115564593 [Drosophila navojoa]TDG40789.1 hypothetical protein AWZ03_012787 [Drosophila navojoa]